MIVGSFSFSPESRPEPGTDTILESGDYENLTFCRIDQGRFSGGYFLNKKLPYTPEDFLFKDEVNELMVLLSGSIYNKAELADLYNLPAGMPDPEMAARLFRGEGAGFVRMLNGDFIIFIYELSKNEAYIFRDHVGIRPLAYHIDSQGLSFSSDIIGLSRAFSRDQITDREYLLGHFKYIDYRRTPCDRVKKMPPGHFLHLTGKGVKLTRYWEPEKIRTDFTMQHEQMLADFKKIVHDAVRIRCDGRFSAGAHVSGGIDSGIVSTLARREYPGQEIFPGFSWSPAGYNPTEISHDERELVIKTCTYAGITPLFSDIDTDSFRRIISEYYYNLGQFYESATVGQAASSGTNLIFSGWGGDDYISTGDRGIEYDLIVGLRWRAFFRRNPLNRPKAFVKSMLFYVVYPVLGILDRSTARLFRNDARYIIKPFNKSDRKALGKFYFHTSRRRLHLNLLRFYHLQNRCESWMRYGYMHGVEYRYPLLDRRIIEYMLRVPSVLLCKTDYYRPILREISHDILPGEVRLNWHKKDPVHWTFIDDLFKESAISFMDEADKWKANPDLHFVDFELLSQDIEKYKAHPGDVDGDVLFRALVYLKAINDFTVKFHQKFQGSIVSEFQG